MAFLVDPFLWAFVSAMGIVAGNAIQGSPVVGRNQAFGFIVIVTATLGRVVLVLPAVVQPRFAEGGAFVYTAGALILAAAGLLMVPLLRIKPLTRPDASEPLTTRGAFGFIRHPGYSANVLLGLGCAVFFGSTIGVLLTPVWFGAFWLHALIEEEALIAKYGAPYKDYMARVPARLIPRFGR